MAAYVKNETEADANLTRTIQETGKRQARLAPRRLRNPAAIQDWGTCKSEVKRVNFTARSNSPWAR